MCFINWRFSSSIQTGRYQWNKFFLFQLYDRLGKHAYQPRPEDKSGNDTTSESDDDRSRRQ